MRVSIGVEPMQRYDGSLGPLYASGTSLSGVEVKLDRWMRSTKSNDSKSDLDDAPSTSDLPSRLHSLLSRKLHPNKIG